MQSPEILKNICKLHNITKTYLIRCEYLTESTLIQPVKEFRDAYDHILKTFFLAEDSDIVTQNLERAYSHEFRAFMDTLDYYCVQLMKRIGDIINSVGIPTLRKNYKHFPELFRYLIQSEREITKIRKERENDLRKGNIDAYTKAADKLDEYYKELVEVVAKLKI